MKSSLWQAKNRGNLSFNDVATMWLLSRRPRRIQNVSSSRGGNPVGRAIKRSNAGDARRAVVSEQPADWCGMPILRVGN